MDKCEDFHKEIRKELEKNNYSYAESEENEHELLQDSDLLNVRMKAMKKFLLQFKKSFKESFEKVKTKARSIKKELKVIYLACKRPDIPWYARLTAILVVGYALSPIDLIPDFVPVLGYLDDIILVPLGISLVIILIPKEILDECRAQADEVFKEGKPKNWIAGALIVLIWITVVSLILFRIFRK